MLDIYLLKYSLHMVNVFLPGIIFKKLKLIPHTGYYVHHLKLGYKLEPRVSLSKDLLKGDMMRNKTKPREPNKATGSIYYNREVAILGEGMLSEPRFCLHSKLDNPKKSHGSFLFNKYLVC